MAIYQTSPGTCVAGTATVVMAADKELMAMMTMMNEMCVGIRTFGCSIILHWMIPCSIRQRRSSRL
jgi:hypothetical protein